jgi:hypothetical protein
VALKLVRDTGRRPYYINLQPTKETVQQKDFFLCNRLIFFSNIQVRVEQGPCLVPELPPHLPDEQPGSHPAGRPQPHREASHLDLFSSTFVKKLSSDKKKNMKL